MIDHATENLEHMGRLVGSASFFKAGPPSLVGRASLSVTDFLVRNVVGRVLDLGGGRGAYSVELRDRGHEVVLGEIDPACLASASKEGLEVVDLARTPLESCRGAFDTVAMLEVLEHVEDYEAFLASALACARRRVILTVPCNDDFDDLFSLGLTYNHIAVTDHVNHFTSRSLSELLDRTGCRYSIEVGDFLFEPAFMKVAIRELRRSVVGYPLSLALRLFCRFGPEVGRYPSRLFVVVEKP